MGSEQVRARVEARQAEIDRKLGLIGEKFRRLNPRRYGVAPWLAVATAGSLAALMAWTWRRRRQPQGARVVAQVG